MKFTVSLAEFSKVLNKVLPAIPRKSTLPVLEHLHFTLQDGQLDIVATDQDIIIKVGITVMGIDNGAVLVPARRLSEIVKALDSIGSIDFENDPYNFDIKISTSVGTYDMKGLDPDEYLHLPELFDSEKPNLDNLEINPDKNIAVFKPHEISRLTNTTAFAVSTDEFRAAMTGVLFQFRGSFINAVATDSFRLVRVKLESEEVIYPEEFDVIIPARAIDYLKKVDSDVIMSSIDSYGKITHLRFDIQDLVFITRIIDERYPPYETVVPQYNDKILKVSRKEFTSSVKRISIFTNQISNQIRIEVFANELVISAEDEDSGAKAIERLNCDFNSEEIILGFNYKYLEDALTHLEPNPDDGDYIYFHIGEAVKPILLYTAPEEKDVLMLLMPVRVAARQPIVNEPETSDDYNTEEDA